MAAFTLVDWFIVAVILLSSLISIQRGFVKEALSLVTLVAAMIVARVFGAQVSTLLIDHIEVASVRSAVAFAGLFFATLVIGGLINHLIVQVIRMAGLSGTDRLLGMLFGFARGALIIVVITAVLARLGLTADDWWTNSSLIPHFVELGDWIYVFGAENAGQLLDQVRSVETLDLGL